jgi:hypothetical protein
VYLLISLPFSNTGLTAVMNEVSNEKETIQAPAAGTVISFVVTDCGFSLMISLLN